MDALRRLALVMAGATDHQRVIAFVSDLERLVAVAAKDMNGEVFVFRQQFPTIVIDIYLDVFSEIAVEI